jgi:hypothetical protein
VKGCSSFIVGYVRQTLVATNSSFRFCLISLSGNLVSQVERINVEELDTGEFEHVPNTEALAGRLRCCLQAFFSLKLLTLASVVPILPTNKSHIKLRVC